MNLMKKQNVIISLVIGLAIISVLFSGCIDNNNEESPSENVTIKGSSTVLPIATLAAEAFMELYPNITVSVAGGGSSVGIRSVATGEADIGDASREVKQSEIEEYPEITFYDNKVALDGVAILVSKAIYDAGVTDITMEQLRGIYNGTITQWDELGGPTEEIFINEREEGSGTRDTFMELVGLEETVADSAHSANSQVKQAVGGSEVGIGYAGLGFIDDTTPALAIDSIAPSEATITSGDYPISRSLHMYTNGQPTGAVKLFIDFVLGEEGQDIVAEEGFITIN